MRKPMMIGEGLKWKWDDNGVAADYLNLPF